jgi:hypothetical protein
MDLHGVSCAFTSIFLLLPCKVFSLRSTYYSWEAWGVATPIKRSLTAFLSLLMSKRAGSQDQQVGAAS